MRNSPILDYILEVERQKGSLMKWREKRTEQLKKRVTHSGTRGRLQKGQALSGH